MSNINLRTYGNMIYGNISKYLTEYIEPDINKDEFIEMFNKGKLNVDNLKLKNGKNFIIDSKFKLSFFSCKIFEAMIPDENSNLEIYIKDAKISINLIELNYDNLEEILISEIKSFTDNYINYAIQKVQNKDNAPSMIEGMIQNIILKIINNDFKFEIKNIEISLKFNDIILIFSIDKIQFNKEEIKIEKINVLLKETSLEMNVLNNLRFNIKIDNSNDIEKKENNIKIFIEPFEIKLETNVLIKIKKILGMIEYNKYKLLYYRQKCLIEYYKPKNKKNYRELWLFAIKTVIKLRKYYLNGELNIFDFNEFKQKKIVNNYYNNINVKDILAIDKKKIIFYSKEKIEKAVIEEKKKQIINPFAFFFQGNKNENKNELNEKEKEELDNLCKIENIENYLNQKFDKKKPSNPIQGIIFDFIKKINIEILFSKITLNLIHNNNSVQIYLNEILINIMKNENIVTYQFFLKDMEFFNDLYDKISFFNEKINNDNALSISFLENKKIDINFNFKDIQFDDHFFSFILSYLSAAVQIQKKDDDIFNQQSINLKIKNYISLYNKINFPFIPTISIFTYEDRITFFNIIKHKIKF